MHRPPGLQVLWAPLLTQNSSYHHQPGKAPLPGPHPSLTPTRDVPVGLDGRGPCDSPCLTCAQLPFTRALAQLRQEPPAQGALHLSGSPVGEDTGPTAHGTGQAARVPMGEGQYRWMPGGQGL